MRNQKISRLLAQELRREFEGTNQLVLLDFQGVSSLNYVFAKELIGTTIIEMGENRFRQRIRLKNLDLESKRVIEKVIRDSIQAKAA